MQSFVVSARKYRPSTFDLVVGQEHITSTLKNAIVQKHLAQAFLFCGPRGVGKTTCARILAKTINCESLNESGEACGTCASCHAFQNQNSFNIHELDAASHNSVDDIRQLIDQVRVPPQYGKYKVYIIDEVHMLTSAAFNAFLKTLEEPPSYAIFILATTEKHKIIPTILSRCQIFDFNRIRNQDISGQLEKVAAQEGIEFEPDALRHIARKADGGMRDALSMFDMISTFSPDRKITLNATLENLHILDSENYSQILDFILEENSSALLLLLDEIIRKGFDAHHFLLGLGEYLRNVLLATDPATLEMVEENGETLKRIMRQSNQTGFNFNLNLLNLVNQAELQYRNSRHPRLLVELCLLKMANIRRIIASHEIPGAKETTTTNSLKNPMASLVEVKEASKARTKTFIRTPSITTNRNPSNASEPDQNANDPEKEQKKKILNLATAKDEYLSWFQNKGLGSFSSWSMAKKEEITSSGFRLFFIKGSISEEQFLEEEKIIKSYFNEYYSQSPDFELAQLTSENGSDRTPYSNLEKFQFLSKKHPEIEKLKNILNLDFSW
jgi:DNA polymerase-3 subunit gamma/tau